MLVCLKSYSKALISPKKILVNYFSYVIPRKLVEICLVDTKEFAIHVGFLIDQKASG